MIRFYAKRHIFLAISCCIFIVGIVAMFINGISLDIEFKGGSILKYEYIGEIDTDEADVSVSAALNRAATCQTMTENVTANKFLVVSLAGNEGLSSQQQELLNSTLEGKFPDAGLSLYETSIVEPFIGQKFLLNGITAIAISFFLIILYVGYSFRKIGGISAGIMALIALIHDCFVVFFAFIVFKIPINENFIAAALTIIGFSINDTIVIYDRIRENTALSKGKISIEELVDKSITQSLTRSINTNAMVFISIVIVCVFAQIYGLSSITSFALPMTFGVISGCYSTICISGPLWVGWKKHAQTNAARQ